MTEFNHHGIEGQKWGVRNGPPYPLDRMVSTGKALKSTLEARKKHKLDEKYKKRATKIAISNQKIEYYKAKNELQRQKLLYKEGKSKEFFMLPTGETVMDRNARKRAEYEKDRDFAFKVNQQKAQKQSLASTVKKTLLDSAESLAKDAIKDMSKPYIDTAIQSFNDARFPENKMNRDREARYKRTKDIADYEKSMTDIKKAQYQRSHPDEVWGKNSNKNNREDEDK